jgi:phage FluMu protein Com
MNQAQLSWGHYVDPTHKLRAPGIEVDFDHEVLLSELGFKPCGYLDELAAFIKAYKGPRRVLDASGADVGISFLSLEGEIVGYLVQICPRCRERAFFRDDEAASKVYDRVARIVKGDQDFPVVTQHCLPGFDAILYYK